jgi:thiol:disulfide interchange protein DsbD
VKVTFPPRGPVEVVGVEVPPGVRSEEAGAPADERVFTGRTVVAVTVKVKRGEKGPVHVEPVVEFQGCSDKACFAPERRKVPIDIPIASGPSQIVPIHEEVFGEKTALGVHDELETLVRAMDEQHDFGRTVAARGYLAAFLAAILSGFLVSLTPCVWPLVPVVLAVVGAKAEGAGWKRGLGLSVAYVLGLSITYAALGALAGFLGKSVQGLVQSPILVGLVSLVFVALALSMFGVFEIRVPAGLAGKLQQKRRAGAAGVLVTGVVSGLVASPCVSAPLLGLFAGVASLGSVAVGAFAGFLFAWGMGVILVVAGTSSKALQALPRSGEWMVSVKRFFGWVLLGAAIYFAHMVVGTTAYRLLMGGLLMAGGVFLGALQMSALGSTTWGKIVQWLGIVALVVGLVYFVGGVAPLVGLAPGGQVQAPAGAAGIRWETSLDEGLARAAAEKKPALIDFWAEWCSYCHEMDRDVLSREAVIADSERLVMIRVDVTVQTPTVDELYKKYGIVGPPAFVFVRTNGEHSTVNHTLELEPFLRLMRAAR